MKSRAPKAAFVVFLVAALFAPRAAYAQDWPMWRHDTARSGASPEALPESLHLRWVWQLPKPVPAWPNETRLHFDTCYRPVAAGKLLFVGSPNQGSITAYEMDSGTVRWTFHTNGPVRFAPVVWKDKVIAGSDDGYLYCLEAKSGAEVWRLRGVPDDRPERRHLGNARLVSFWPVRGAPVVADGIVYFAAGIWPTMGIFVHAVKAETGECVWMNDRLHYISDVRVDHNELHDTGLSPQGYLLVSGDRLLVPNGRSMPAVLNRHTGELLCYTQNYRRGHWRVAAAGDSVFVGPSAVLDLETGRELGSRYHEAEKKPRGFDNKQRNFFEGPYFDYKHIPGCDAESVFLQNTAYGSHAGAFFAYVLADGRITLTDSPDWGGTWKVNEWEAPVAWKLAAAGAKQDVKSGLMIAAGSRLYGHVGNTLTALELPSEEGQPAIVWKHELDGTPAEMLAADGKLFVVTEDARMLCFSNEQGEVAKHGRGTEPFAAKEDAWTEKARAVLSTAGAQDGYCVVLGIDSGRLVEELLRQSEMHLIAIGRDSARVKELRDRLTAAGLYGRRAEAFCANPLSFALPPYLASLVVSETLNADALKGHENIAGLLDSIRPYGGVACFDVGDKAAVKAWLPTVDTKPFETAFSDGRLLIRREGPLPDSASWTHETADAARTYFSKDKRVRAPLGVLWYGDGPGYGFWKHKDYGVGVKPQVVGGSLFAFRVNHNVLCAVDAYTGRQLWERKVEHFTRYVSMEDGVYVAGGDSVVVYDPATGEERKRFVQTAAEDKPAVADIRVSDRVIITAVSEDKTRNIEKGLWDSTKLIALERQTGERLWTREAERRFSSHALVMGGGSVYCTDTTSHVERRKVQRRGAAPGTDDFVVMGLDEESGEVRWEQHLTVPYYTPTSWLSVRGHDDWLAYSEECAMVLAGKSRKAFGLDARTGEVLWARDFNVPQPVILSGCTFISQQGQPFDIRTGDHTGDTTYMSRAGCRGCNYGVANPHLFFVRDSTASYVDVQTGQKHHLRSVRSGCSNSLIAADGVLSVPNFSVGCICNYPIQTAFAMVHMPEAGAWEGTEPVREPLAME